MKILAVTFVNGIYFGNTALRRIRHHQDCAVRLAEAHPTGCRVSVTVDAPRQTDFTDLMSEAKYGLACLAQVLSGAVWSPEAGQQHLACSWDGCPFPFPFLSAACRLFVFCLHGKLVWPPPPPLLCPPQPI